MLANGGARRASARGEYVGRAVNAIAVRTSSETGPHLQFDSDTGRERGKRREAKRSIEDK